MTTATAPAPTYDEVASLVDRSACFNFFAAPGPGGWSLHALEVDLLPPSAEGVRWVNGLGPALGRLDLRLAPVPEDFAARPDREPPPVSFEAERSQRVALQEAVFRFGDGQDGFRGFGTGRTFPLIRERRLH